MQVPLECPFEVEQLIDMCLATDPSERPTAKQAFDIISSCATPAASALPANAASQPVPPVQELATHQAISGGAASQKPSAAAQSHGLQGAIDPGQAGQQFPAAPAQSKLLPHNSHSQPPNMASEHSPSKLLQSAGNAASSPPGQLGTATPGLRDQRQQHSNGMAKHEGIYAQASLWLDSGPLNGVQSPATAMPTGVYGHLYPSPFAAAMDTSSGPLWDWQQSPVV